MPLLSDANKIYLGSQAVDTLYLGTNKVWPSKFDPSMLAGLTVWLDAATLRGFPLQQGLAPNTVGNSPFALGVHYKLLDAGKLLGARLFHTGNSTYTTRTMRLYDLAGTLLASTTPTTEATGVAYWANASFPTPVSYVANQEVIVCFDETQYPQGDLAATSDPSRATMVEGRYGAIGGFPGNAYGYNLFADLIIDAPMPNGAAVSPWPDLSGAGNHGTITRTPLPTLRTNALNSKAVVRFRTNEGVVRGNSGIGSSGLPSPYYNYTIVYVTRMVGPTVGRAFSASYPPSNFLVGFHSSGMDTAYDGSGFLVPASAFGTLPTAWKLYSMTGFNNGSSGTDAFYSNGVLLGSGGGGTGLQNAYNLSGYDPGGTQETCDCEVAELVIYNRRLADAERQQVEAYLRTKWGLP